MCGFSKPDTPELPKPKKPLPTPTQDSDAVNNAAIEAQRKRRAAGGRQQSLLNGNLGEAQTQRKVLLGG